MKLQQLPSSASLALITQAKTVDLSFYATAADFADPGGGPPDQAEKSWQPRRSSLMTRDAERAIGDHPSRLDWRACRLG